MRIYNSTGRFVDQPSTQNLEIFRTKIGYLDMRSEVLMAEEKALLISLDNGNGGFTNLISTNFDQ